MRLVFADNFDKFLEIGDTSASKKLDKFVIAVTWLWNIDKMFSLCPRDTLNLRNSKLTDKLNSSVDVIQELNTIDGKLAHPSFVQRTNITELSTDICISNYHNYYAINHLSLKST